MDVDLAKAIDEKQKKSGDHEDIFKSYGGLWCNQRWHAKGWWNTSNINNEAIKEGGHATMDIWVWLYHLTFKVQKI